MRLFLNKLFFTVLLSLSLSTYGQPSRHLYFNDIGQADGFSGQIFYTIYQDQYNLIWFGCGNGLYSWDGYRMKNYINNTADSSSISSSHVNAICDLNDTSLAIGTGNGVNIYNRKTDSFTTVECTKGVLVLDMALDKNNVLWVSTNNGIYSYDNNSGAYRNFCDHPKNANDYIPGNYIIGLHIHNNLVIAGAHGNVSFFDRTTNKFIHYRMPIECGIVICMIESLEEPGKYWIGTDKLLFLWDRNTDSIEVQFKNTPIKNLTYDHHNNLWVGTDNGLYLKAHKHKDFEKFSHNINDRHSLPSNIVWNTLVDRENNLWVATTNGISLTSLNQELTIHSINDIVDINHGMQFFYVSTNNNDIVLAGTWGAIIKNRNTNNSVWLHTYAPKNNSITHNRARHIYLDNDNIYWIATDMGLNSYDSKSKKTRAYNISEPSNRYKSAWMYHIAYDAGLFYLSTYDGGVFVVSRDELLRSKPMDTVMSSRHFSSSSTTQPIPSNLVNGVYLNKHSRYFTTHNNGILKVPYNSSEPVEHLTSENGKLNSNLIISMESVNDTTFCVTTNNSIEILTSSGEHRVAFTSIDQRINSSTLVSNNELCVNTPTKISLINLSTGKYKSFNTSNLGISPIHSVFYDTITKKLYCGGVDKYIAIDLQSINYNDSNDKPIITNLFLGDRLIKPSQNYDGNTILKSPISLSSSIELLANQNSFSLEFSTLRYSQTSSQSYVYRLKGLSDDWIVNTSGNNRATFFNVPAGKYLFEVAIQDSNELHIETVSSLEIIVLAPFYLTSEAYLLYCFLIASITFIVVKYVRRKHQRELYELERSKSLNYSQIKIDFLTNTSHELKTPLSLILGRLSMLIVNEKNPEKRQKLLSIQNSAEQIKNLTLKNLKSNLETQGLYSDLDLRPIEITNFTKTIHSSFEEKLREKSIRFSFNEPSEPIYAMIDSNLFWSVLENLLSNSIKFTPHGGSINISVSRNNSTNNVSISVSDTGCGIDPLKLPYVFDRYYKTSFESDGHGLGLAIARDIVTAHNGTISVISTLNSGSEFTVNLPLAERSTSNNTIAQKHRDTLANILVVEDNCEMLDFICEGLSENFNCNRASDGVQGFQIALEQRPALIITDLEMPNMTGFELTEKVRDNIFICHTPIIMLTAHSDKASEIESYSKGVDAYIRKPFDINDLTIRAWQLIKKSETHKEKIRQQSLAHINEANIVSVSDKFIETITGIIENRISDNTLTVTSLSNDCAMSEKQIYRRLKQLTGLTPNEYVRQVRLNRAAMLLKQGGFSVSEVLFMVGFSNPSYFTKCFKTQFRVTPSEYMDAYKEKK